MSDTEARDIIETQNESEAKRGPESGHETESSHETESGHEKLMVLPVNEDSKKITKILSNETSIKILELLGKKSMSATDISDELALPLTTVKYNLDSLIESDLIKVEKIRWSQKGRQIKIYGAMDKLIVLVPNRTKADKLSIISLLQQYIGVLAGAAFAAAGLEGVIGYLRLKNAVPALDTGMMKAAYEGSDAVIAANNTTSAGNVSTEIVNGDSQIQAAVAHVNGTINETLREAAEKSTAAPLATGGGPKAAETLSSPPAEISGISHYLSDLYHFLMAHPGAWFFLGCLFIVCLLVLREVYNSKKDVNSKKM